MAWRASLLRLGRVTVTPSGEGEDHLVLDAGGVMKLHYGLRSLSGIASGGSLSRLGPGC